MGRAFGPWGGGEMGGSGSHVRRDGARILRTHILEARCGAPEDVGRPPGQFLVEVGG